MDKKEIGYWATTGLVSLAFTVGGIANLVGADPQVEVMTKLGFPLYVMTLLGTFKLLGVIAILAPRFPRLKEWAYAGIAFDLIGAAWAHIAAGEPIPTAIPPLVVLSLAMISYALRPESRKLA